MHEYLRRDGAVVLTDDGDDNDQVVVEAVIGNFAPARGNAFCVCGAALRPWGWRCVAADTVEIGCDRCHRVHGHFTIGVRVHR